VILFVRVARRLCHEYRSPRWDTNVKGAVTSGFQETLTTNRRFVRNARVLIGTVRGEKSTVAPCERATDQSDSSIERTSVWKPPRSENPLFSQSLSKIRPLLRHRLTSAVEEAKIDASPKNKRQKLRLSLCTGGMRKHEQA
jgi:hypothetical protein